MFMNLVTKLAQTSKLHPNRVAINYGDQSVTYQSVYERSCRVAQYFVNQNITNACIGITVSHTANHIIALLGVMASGNYYLSVTEQNKEFIPQSQLQVLLTIADEADNEAATLSYEQLLQEEYVPYQTGHGQLITPTTNMCAFFTSGSTGRAKVVIHRHQNIYTDTIRQINDNQINNSDVLDLTFSLSFSASLACIFPALLTGARLSLFNLKERGLYELANFWQQEEVTFSTLSVTSFQGVCKVHPSLQHLNALRFISISAEPVKSDTVKLFQSRFAPGTTLQIAYASTETRTISELKIINNREAIPYPDSIGKPVEGKRVIIADAAGKTLGPDERGEIIVESGYIADAYDGNTEESALSFSRVNNSIYYKTGDTGYLNTGGYLFYEGRLNSEHKINGIRINLAEIDGAVERVNGVIKAATVVNVFNTQHPKLLCFYEAVNPTAVTGTIIKEAIENQLPATHLPHVLVCLPRIPTTHTGKTDRKKLEQWDMTVHTQGNDTEQQVTHENLREQAIMDIFGKTLGITQVNGNTNFFDAGGDSMSQLICIAEIESHFNVSLHYIDLIAYPTPQLFAAFLTNHQQQPPALINTTRLNEHFPNRSNFYFLNHGKNNFYEPFVNTVLSSRFNLLEIVYDLYGNRKLGENPELVIEQLKEEIAAHPNSIVAGYSFSGFVAHQLSCIVPGIAYCVLIDTVDYFDYDKYITPVTFKKRLQSLQWQIFENKDSSYPLYYLQERFKTVPVKPQSGNNIFNNGVNAFLLALKHPLTINNCIYFQATRSHKNLSESWGSRVGGTFNYIKLRCTHEDILKKKSAIMAEHISQLAGRLF
jgi:acyl-coenzyme A synthetase/AMP-(fatty) acid ligase